MSMYSFKGNFKKCEECGETFYKPPSVDRWKYKIHDFMGIHWFCGYNCMMKWERRKERYMARKGRRKR